MQSYNTITVMLCVLFLYTEGLWLIKMDFLNITEMMEITSPEETLAKMKANRESFRGWMEQTSHECSLDEFTVTDNQNRYTVNYEDVPFECLWMPFNNKKLYVLLSGGRMDNKKMYPLFMRWKYQNALNGNVLCIEDPMYYFYAEYSHVLWYYGTKEVSYLELLIDVVKKVMNQLSIDASDVTFVGSSGGGYSALYCANLLDYSAALAMNPQIVLKEWYAPVVYNDFMSIGIDLAGEDKFGRNVLKLTNKTSRFMLVLNAISSAEWGSQFVPFFENHGITPKYGITQTDNIVTWLHTTEYNDPHLANPLQNGMMFAVHVLDKVKAGESIENLYGMSLLANEALSEVYELKDAIAESEAEKRSFYKYFMRSITAMVKRSLSEKISHTANEKLKNFLDGNFNCRSVLWKITKIGIYIGEQDIYRYNIIYDDKTFYIMMVLENVSEHLDKNVLTVKREAFQREIKFHLFKDDSLRMSYVLKPDNIDEDVDKFVDFTVDVINKYIK